MLEGYRRNKNEWEKHDLSNLTWSLKSILNNFDKIYSQVEKYADLIKAKLKVVEKQLDEEVKELMKIEEFDLDKPYFHTRKTENIVFLDTEESAEELIQLLTK